MHCSLRLITLLIAVSVGISPFGSTAAEDNPASASVRELKIDPISRNFMNPSLQDFYFPDEAGLDNEVVFFTNESNETLRGWFIRTENAKQTILFCMGNTGNISGMLLYAKLLAEGGFNVLLFDYQGFGGSTGIASALSLRGDTLAAFDYLTSKRGISSKDIGVFGVSLGSPLAIAVAAEREAGAVAVEDILLPSLQIERMKEFIPDDFATRMALGGLKAVVLPRVEPLTNVPRLKCPLFLMHGENDWLLPPSGTVDVAKISQVPTRVWIMQGAGHAPETLEIHELEYASQVQRFFREALSQKISDPAVTLASRKNGNEWIATVTIVPDVAEPVTAWQIAVGSAEGKFRFAREMSGGEFNVEVVTPFEPVHASAIGIQHVTVQTGSLWTPKLSELSEALAEFRKFQAGIEKNCRWQMMDVSVNGRSHRISVRAPQDWDWFQQQLPPNNIHPIVRPRYAREIAQFFCRLKKEDQEACLPIVATMLAYLPENPEKYYQLDNAGFQVKLEDPYVERCLVCLARKQISSGLTEEANTTLRLAVRVAVPHSPLKMSDINQLTTGRNLEALLGLK